MRNEQLENVLYVIGSRFNKEKITYGIGGSGVLVAFNILDTMHDIDIVVDTKALEKVRNILRAMSKGKEIYTKIGNYQYNIDGIEVEIISDKQVVHEEGVYIQQFSKFHITNKIVIRDVAIPVMALEDWFVLYDLFEREERVKQIRTYFNKNGIANEDLLHLALDGCLPIRVQSDIRSLIIKNKFPR